MAQAKIVKKIGDFMLASYYDKNLKTLAVLVYGHVYIKRSY